MSLVREAGKLNRFAWRLEAFLSKGPAYLYAYARWKLLSAAHRLQDVLGTRPVSDTAFLNALDLSAEELSAVRQAVVERNGTKAGKALVAHFQTRLRPEFHFGPADKSAILSGIVDEWRDATIRAADDACQNLFTFRCFHPIQFETQVDWTYRPEGNTDWTWDLNRHPYFNALGKAYWYTGNEKYAEKFVELVLDWIDRNPAGTRRPNWDSVLEIAARLNNWIWAYQFFRQAKAFHPDAHIAFLKGLLTLARHLAARMEHHAANNHLFLEAKALAFCGVLFPEFKEAKAWRKTGLNILWRQVERQVCVDGVHAERSTLYHRIVTSELLEMVLLLDKNGVPVPRRVVERLKMMIEFDSHITKPDGTIPLLGDAALADNYLRFSGRGGRDEEMVWLLAGGRLGRGVVRDVPVERLESKPFVEGGYFVMRGGERELALYLVFDCGPFGYQPVPNHGHADALSFDLYAYGRTLITDCGAYSYHHGERWRNYFRGTRAHNTVMVDGQDQSILMGTRHVYRAAQATLHEWVSNAVFDFVSGSHDGYCRLADPVTHWRSILFVKPEYWIVFDFLAGHGVHTLEQYFHLAPGAAPRADHSTGSMYVDEHGSPAITLAPMDAASLRVDVVSGATDPVQGWVSLYSGEKLAAPVVIYQQTVQLPALFGTVLYPHPPGSACAVQAHNLPVRVDGIPADQTMISGITVETPDYVDMCVVSHGDAPAWKTFAGVESDARIIYLRRRNSDGAVVRMATEPTTATLRVH